jgi:catechol 2,3-dioxygenase-like lactoylglutathione lyase family enzyme
VPLIAFNHFNIRAPSALLRAVRDFYVDVIGLEAGPRPDVPVAGYWLYLSDLPVLHLMEWPDGPQVPDLEEGYLDHIAFSCRDETTFIDRFEQLAVPFQRREFTLPSGEQFLQLMVSDPTGLGVELNFIVSSS